MANPVKVTIDGKTTEAQPADTILTVARRLGIEIPTLCYTDGKKPGESCGICMVEADGREGFVAACATRVHDGMTVRTDTEGVRKVRRLALDLLLSDHLGDCIAPCQLGCPAHIDIPRFIQLIREGRYPESIGTIKESVAFPGVLGRICPRICENVCRRKELDEPVSIFSLKRFAADQDMRSGAPYIPKKKPSSGKRVAIVGAGIAGLTAAYYLLVEGHDCTVFDAQSAPGGAMRLIPEFRLPREIVRAEIAILESLGARFRMNAALGKELTLDALQKDYDAVLLTIGRSRESTLGIPGGELAVPSTEFLRQAADGRSMDVGRAAVVMGTGPGALDLCRALVRLGVEQVRLVPDKSVESVHAFQGQIEDARRQGIEVLPASEARRIEKLPEGGFRIALRGDAGDLLLEAERVFYAGDMEPDVELLRTLGIQTTDRSAEVDRKTLATSVNGVFAAGGAIGGGRYAVHASASGRLAAESIGRYLRGEESDEKRPIHVVMHHLTEKDLENFYRDFQKSARLATDRAAPDEARRTFSEVDRGFSEETAGAEARRCLSCACAKKDDCKLRIYATEYEADPHKYSGERQPFEREITHEEVIYEPAKCIKCGKCIQIAEEAKEPLGLTYIGRGFRVRVGVPFGETLREALKKVALRCVDACPTGALARRRKDR